MKFRRAGQALSVIAGAAMLTTVVSAVVYTFHNGSNCVVYNGNQIVFQQVCAPGQIAHCDIVPQPGGNFIVEGWCEGEPAPNPK